ncbi:TetR/AcrR family transcriptional regulator [Actinoplanes sp. RD1]|uniref:TetR/AcrR family transcriptional regulator n=1 Tax=Actinoplanes sp. RD1 TaxID=3064538 RepID=UPI002741728A|nr:TetR family transcriptional regulator [Actinoplanes sp. RD1]
MRADAERSTARILAAAGAVLAVDATASLERIADEAGLARATVHRRFATRQALLDALVEQLNRRYLSALEQARVTTAPPADAFLHVNEIVFELKISHRAAMELAGDKSREVMAGLELLFTRLREAGEITAAGPRWCCGVYLALLNEVDRLPADAPDLVAAGGRPQLLTRTVLSALGGK